MRRRGGHRIARNIALLCLAVVVFGAVVTVERQRRRAFDRRDDDWPKPPPLPRTPTERTAVASAMATAAGHAGLAAAPVAPTPRPTTVFPLLRFPAEVRAGDDYEIVAGVSAEPAGGVVGDPIAVPSDDRISVSLEVEGCSVDPGESLSADIDLSNGPPYRPAVVRVRADEQDELRRLRTIEATYASGHDVLGRAMGVLLTRRA